MRYLFVVLIGLLLSGCVNAYSKFYQDRTGGMDLTTSPRVIISTDKPRLFRGNNLDDDYIRLLEDGFGLVGISSFNGAGNVNADDAIIQAERIHAAVVLVYSKYINTTSGVLPLTSPDIQTSTTTMSGNVMGPGGMATYSGNAYSTYYGTRTTYIPYSVNRYDYFASYWIKMKPPILGVNVRDLTSEMTQKIGSNKGVFVIAVIKGSPAFHGDILKGDILKRIGDKEFIDAKSFGDIVSIYAGKKVEIILLRDGKEITKEIVLSERT